MCENAYKQRLEVDVESHHHSSTMASQSNPDLIDMASLPSQLAHCLPRQEIQVSSVLVVFVNLTKPRVS